ncbi:hypothetical protein CABS01_09383 [Colletotrichum abscissum]|uniref:Uncharacterized protein n=2 Tax=Colletotrichum acutatum species complex TaxID=2707335 RepID=A0A9Q0B8I3_9PEZI|nr:uncharacterized protein CABS01_09383 [Colletotrichum abscissum]KAI3555842.1 hypothetical protein CABS02_03896 [Colletotrichum abscissum]KAK1502772.1 hypothetical protein CABS01_09383 [Colletotrichum abscissum]
MITPSDTHHQPASSRGWTWCAASGPIGNLLRAHHRSPSQGSSPLARHYDVLGRWFNGSPHPPVRCWSAATPWLASDSTTFVNHIPSPSASNSMHYRANGCHPGFCAAMPNATSPVATLSLLFVCVGFQKHEWARIWVRAFGLPSDSAIIPLRVFQVVESCMEQLPSMLHNRHCYFTIETCLQVYRQWKPAPVDIRRTASVLWMAVQMTHHTHTYNPLAKL